MELSTDEQHYLAARYEVADDGCWIWKLKPMHTGYGRIHRAGKYKSAHRAVYEAHRGPVPDGMELDHLCNVRLCVNPDHLEPVTHAENLRRLHERDPEAAQRLRNAATAARERKTAANWRRLKMLRRAGKL